MKLHLLFTAICVGILIGSFTRILLNYFCNKLINKFTIRKTVDCYKQQVLEIARQTRQSQNFQEFNGRLRPIIEEMKKDNNDRNNQCKDTINYAVILAVTSLTYAFLSIQDQGQQLS